MRKLLIALSFLLACEPSVSIKKAQPTKEIKKTKPASLSNTTVSPVPKPTPKRTKPSVAKATQSLQVLSFDDVNLDGIEIKGTVKRGFRWSDKRGDNVVIISSKSLKDGQSLYIVHHLLGESGSVVREVNEHNACVSYRGDLDLRHSALGVSDIDRNGIGEFTFGYVKACGGDQVPEYKLFLIEDGEKFALRGTQKVLGAFENEFKQPMGIYKADRSLSKKPKFLSHLKSVWAATSDILKDIKKNDLSAVLRTDGLKINNKSVKFPKRFRADNTCPGAPVELTIESFDPSVHAIYYRARTCTGNEDPPDGQLIYLMIDGKAIDALRSIYFSYSYSTQTVRFIGDGTIRYTESDWGACERDKRPYDAPKTGFLRNYSLRYDASKSRLVADGFENSKYKYDCDELAACPYVYIQEKGSEKFVGEILRDLIGKNAYELQSLPLPPSVGGKLIVRLSEEKDEKTFLDEIYIEVDGLRTDPNSCASKDPVSYCDEDYKFYTMEKGESHRFEFDVSKSNNIVLWARGFYIPTQR